jgi:hypothetical protein
MIIFLSVLLGIGNVLEKLYRKSKTHFMFSNFFFPEVFSVCEIMWKNVVQPDKPQMTTQYGAYAMHAGLLRLQTRARNVEYLLPFHGNNGYSNTI